MEETIEDLKDDARDSSSDEIDFIEEPGISEISLPEHSLFSGSSSRTETESDLSSDDNDDNDKQPENIK